MLQSDRLSGYYDENNGFCVVKYCAVQDSVINLCSLWVRNNEGMIQ